jgi:hypothetical protein
VAFVALLTAALMPPAGADSGLSPLELAQVQRANCQVLLAHATSSAQRTRANQCIADQTAIIAALSSSPSPSPSGTQSPSPLPSPTVQPSPSVSPTATTPPATTPPPSPTPTGTLTNCVADPGRCGFPDASSTGPSGPLTVSTRTSYATAGETIANVQINGCTVVRAAGVTFRNVLFNATGCFWGVQSLSSGLSIVDSEITCSGNNGTGIGSAGFSLLRVDIHNCENGLDVGSNASLVDSWIHDMETDNGAHTDGVQIGQGSSNLVFRHNTIAMAAPGATSAIISWDEQAGPQQQGVVIDANLLSGGTYTLYCPRYDTSDTRVTNNRFGPYEYGSSNACTGSHVSAWSGNVIDATGAPLAAG